MILHAAPVRELQLNHRAFYLRVALEGELIVAVTAQGTGTLLASPQLQPRPLLLPKLRGLAVSPDGSRLLLVTEAGIELYIAYDVERERAVRGGFMAAEFSADGQHVYAAERLDDETIRISVRDSATLAALYTAEVEDPFGEAECSIVRHPAGSHFALWIAAGQDGQSVVAVSLHEGLLRVAPLTDLFDVSPPVFNGDGTSVLLITESEELRRYSFPEGELVSTFTWPERDDRLDTYAAFAGADAALVLSDHGRLYFVDLVRNVLVTEVAAPGHLPRPLRELYPSLTEPGLAADADYLAACGAGMFVTTHHVLTGNVDEWRDRVAIWTLPATPSSF